MRKRIHIILLILLLLSCGYSVNSQNLRINELIARNSNGMVDEFGDDDDWIEIYNPSSAAVNLAGLYISDTNATADFFRIPSFNAAKTTVPAEGYLILWADGEPAEGANHLPFKLSNGGEGVYLGELSGGAINMIDELEYPKLERDVTYGRWPNYTGNFRLLSDPSPGAANIEVRTIGDIVINEFMAINNGPDKDTDDESEDWIELFNPTGSSIDVGGMYLTDSIGEKTMHRIPIYAPDSTTIPAGGYLRFWCDAEPTTSIWHIDFKLGRSGEKVTLTQPDGETIIQEVSYPAASSDASFGRYPDGGNDWIYLNEPSPNESNRYNYNTVNGIVINEFMADNESVYPDNLGEIEDWIEIYNTNNYPVDVGGLVFTDLLDEPMRYRIPETYPDSTTIPAKGYLVFWADNDPEQGILHLDIKLTGTGEAVGLYQIRSSIVELDSYTFGLQTPNKSVGRSPDGSPNWISLSQPSPGFENGTGSSFIISGLYVNEFVARNGSGGYQDEFGNTEDWIELYNSTNDPINIGGLFFTDNLDNPKLVQVPENQPTKTIISAKGYLVVWPDIKPELGPLHLNFQLAGAGEDVGVYQEHDGQLYPLQTLTYPAQTSKVSYGRAPDGSANWNFFSYPTPLAPNPSSGVLLLDEASEENVVVYPNPLISGQSLYLKGLSGGEIYWTLSSINGQQLASGSKDCDGYSVLEIPGNLIYSLPVGGLYVLQIVSGSQLYVKKIMKY